MAQGGNEKVCLAYPRRSFNKHNEVMGSSFFTALGFLLIWTAELLCGAETFLPEPHKPSTHSTNCFHGHSLCAQICNTVGMYNCDLKTETSPKISFWVKNAAQQFISDKGRHANTPTSVSNKFQLQREGLLF